MPWTMRNKPLVRVSLSPAFQKDIKRLRKKYLHIQHDIQPFIDQLVEGETPGDQIQAIGYTVYKVRLPNSDARRGKSGGYRVIYYIRTPTQIVLLTIYSKSERSDTDLQNIQDIITDWHDEPGE